MIYDQFPIIDHFRYVNNDMVAGAMDTKQHGDAGVYYFFLRRIKWVHREIDRALEWEPPIFAQLA